MLNDSISISKSLYSQKALISAAYWFSKSASIRFTEDKDNYVVIIDGPAGIVNAFLERLHDEQLRSIIEEETGAIRKLLTAKAFSYGALADEGVQGHLDDPLGMED